MKLDHQCDRNGMPTTVIDESDDPPAVVMYPTCSRCGKAQVFAPSD